MIEINVGRDFSRFPAGRLRKDGDSSAERFREDYLLPPLKRGESVRVILDGTRGFPSSFLEEAFGGLVRSAGISLPQLYDQLEIVAVSEVFKPYALRAMGFIDAQSKRNAAV